ncbi:MAG: sortase [Actinomycetota bacterium]|nr:sortase [Actinomycetota bacterium]
MSLVSVTAVLAAGAACSRGYGSGKYDVPPSTIGRGLDDPILAPPATLAFPPLPTVPTTTVPALPQPVIIPRDSYAPEPVREIGTIEIPALGLVSAIYDGVTLHNIDLGPSHWTGTAEPGQPGNTVFAGHRITNSRPFRNLDSLVAGDEVIFTVAGTRSVYKVTGNLVVGPDDTWIADQTPESTGTLYACHPPGSADYRYVVKLALAA